MLEQKIRQFRKKNSTRGITTTINLGLMEHINATKETLVYTKVNKTLKDKIKDKTRLQTESYEEEMESKKCKKKEGKNNLKIEKRKNKK
jgi:hypothetical protein